MIIVPAGLSRVFWKPLSGYLTLCCCICRKMCYPIVVS